MSAPDYLAMLREKKQMETPIGAGEQTAQSSLRGLCTSPLAQIDAGIPVAAHSGTGAAAMGAAMSPPVPSIETASWADPATLPIVGAGDTATDDRRYCTACQHLLDAVCTIARQAGLVSARRGYSPVALPMRCVGFMPGAGDPDQRPGAERWPGLLEVKP